MSDWLTQNYKCHKKNSASKQTSFFVPAGNLAGSILTSFMAFLNMSWLVTKLTKSFTCGLSDDGTLGMFDGIVVDIFGGGASWSSP